MTFAPPVKTKLSSRLAKSSWTPLSNPTSNNQVFEERREIMKKWFSKWQDGQKRIVVGDIVQSLSQKHLYELHENLNNKFPQEKFDFTKRLPRVLSLYLFSFLDPRTLCRCAQVSWYWNYLTELDSLWRPKCLKFGWYPTYQPSPYEEKIWKRFYVKTVHDLNYAKPKPKTPEGSRPVSARSDHSSSTATLTARSLNETTQLTLNRSTMSGVKRGPIVPTTRRIPPAKWEPPPWKGSDPNPVDTVRFNVLDNKSKYAGKSKRSTSALNTARSLNTGRPKSSARSTRSKKKSTKFNESLDCDVINKNMDSSRSIKTSSKKGSVGDPFEDHGISRLSIDSGKRPQPVVKLERPVRSPNATLKESSIEEETAESVKSSVKSAKSSKVSRQSSAIEKGESSESSVKSASVKAVNVSRRSSVASNAKSSIVQKLMEKEASLRSVGAESVKGSVKSESVSALEAEGSVELKSDSVDNENASVKSVKNSVKSANISVKGEIASIKNDYDKNESVFMDNEQPSVKSEKNSVKSGLASLIDKSESAKDASISPENDQASVKSEKNSVKSAVASVKLDYNEHESVSIVNDDASVKSEKVSIRSEKNSVKGDEANEEDKFSVKSSGLKVSVAGSHRSSMSGKQQIVEDDDDDDVIEEEIAGDVSAVSSHVAVNESISNLHGRGWKVQASDDEDF